MSIDRLMTKIGTLLFNGWIFFVKANVAFAIFLIVLTIATTIISPPGFYRHDNSDSLDHNATRPVQHSHSPTTPRIARRDSFRIDQRIIQEDYIQVPFESSKQATIEECRKELDLVLPSETMQVIDNFVLQKVPVDKLEKLTKEYILKEYVDKEEEIVDSHESPTGQLFQVHLRMVINQSQLQQIRAWEEQILTAERVRYVLQISLLGLAFVTLLSTGLRFLSIRRQSGRKSSTDLAD